MWSYIPNKLINHGVAKLKTKLELQSDSKKSFHIEVELKSMWTTKERNQFRGVNVILNKWESNLCAFQMKVEVRNSLYS